MSSAASAAAAGAGAKTMAVKLRRKRTATEFDGPLLARFPHGPPGQLTKPDEAGEIEFKLHAHSDARKASQRILTASTPGTQYVAQNFGTAHSFKANANQYAIGVFDATKAKVKIIQCNHVYRFDQHVRALDHMDAVSASAADADATFQTRQRVLADTFGSKKTQKRLASRAANEVTVQESTSQILTHAVGSIKPNEMEAEESLLDAIHSAVLPRYDETAQAVRDIYRPNGIVPGIVQDALGPILKIWRAVLKKGKSGVAKDAKSDAPATSTSAFVQNRLESYADAEKNEERDATVKLLIYFDLMLSFRNGGKNKRKLVTDWDPVTKAPERVKEHLLAEFTTSTPGAAAGEARLTYDAHCEQKLLCHLAVTSLLLCNFTLNDVQVDAMASDLKMTTSDMLKYYTEAGATASKSKITLTAPLKLPKLRRKVERK